MKLKLHVITDTYLSCMKVRVMAKAITLTFMKEKKKKKEIVKERRRRRESRTASPHFPHFPHFITACSDDSITTSQLVLQLGRHSANLTHNLTLQLQTSLTTSQLGRHTQGECRTWCMSLRDWLMHEVEGRYLGVLQWDYSAITSDSQIANRVAHGHNLTHNLKVAIWGSYNGITVQSPQILR